MSAEALQLSSQEELGQTPEQRRKVTETTTSRGTEIATALGKEQEYADAAAPVAAEAKTSVRESKSSREELSKLADSEVWRVLEVNFWNIEVDESVLVWTTQAENLLMSKQFLSQHPDSEQIQELLNTDSRRKQIKLKNYFKKNGFPIEETYENFVDYFEIKNESLSDQNAEQSNENVEQNNENVEQNNENTRTIIINNLEPKLKLVSSLEQAKYLTELINGSNNVKPLKDLDSDSLDQRLKEIESYLWNLNNLRIISDAFRELDRQGDGSTNYYAEFRQSVIAVGPELESKFLLLDTQYAVETWKPTDLKTAQLLWSIPDGATKVEDSELWKHVYEKDGYIITIDMTTSPAERTIKTPGSDYAIKTDMPIAEFNGPTVKFEKKKQALTPKIHTLSNLIAEIPSLNSDSVDGIKMLLMSGLTYTFKQNNPEVVQAIEWAKSVEDLKGNTLMELKWLKDKAEKELKDAEEEYEEDLAKQIDSYQKNLLREDMQHMSVATVFRDYGLDSFWDGVLTNVLATFSDTAMVVDLGRWVQISSIETNPFKIEWSGIPTTKPFDASGEMSQTYRLLLAQFANKALSGDPSGPIDTSSVASMLSTPVFRNETGDQIMNIESYVNDRLGLSPYQNIMENLESPIQWKEELQQTPLPKQDSNEPLIS